MMVMVMKTMIENMGLGNTLIWNMIAFFMLYQILPIESSCRTVVAKHTTVFHSGRKSAEKTSLQSLTKTILITKTTVCSQSRHPQSELAVLAKIWQHSHHWLKHLIIRKMHNKDGNLMRCLLNKDVQFVFQIDSQVCFRIHIIIKDYFWFQRYTDILFKKKQAKHFAWKRTKTHVIKKIR